MSMSDFDRKWRERQARIDRNLRVASRCLWLAGVCLVLIVIINGLRLAGVI